METTVSKDFNQVEGKISPLHQFLNQLNAEVKRNEDDYETTGDAIKQVLKQMTGTKYDNEVLKNLLLRRNSAIRNIKTLNVMINEFKNSMNELTQEALNDE